MAVTKVSEGIYRHGGTGFIVHEVYHLADVIEANGVLVDAGAHWMWLAGRDLRDVLAYFQPTTLGGLSGCLRLPKFTGKRFGPPGNVVEYRPIVYLANGWGDVSGQAPRLFALINNLDAGAGCSKVLDNGNSYTAEGGGAAYFGGEPGNGFYGIWGQPRNDAAGMGLVAVPTGYTWASLFDAFGASLPESGRSEVREKLAEGRVLYARWLNARGQQLADKIYHRMPLALMKDGRCLYVPPVRDMFSGNVEGGTSQCNMNSNYTTTNVGATVRAPRYLGARAWNDVGVGMTVPPLVSQLRMFGNIKHAVNIGSWTTATLPVVDELEGLIAVGSIDSVPISLILGGATGMALTDAGTYSPNADSVDVKSAFSLRQYLDDTTIGPEDLPARQIDPGTGAPETDAVVQSRLEAAYAAAKRTSYSGVSTTQYETHGLTLTTGIMVAAASVSAEKQWLLDHHRWDMYGGPKMSMTIHPSYAPNKSAIVANTISGASADWPDFWKKMWPDS